MHPASASLIVKERKEWIIRRGRFLLVMEEIGTFVTSE